MFVRQRNHPTLADHYDDYVTMVKPLPAAIR